jgi:hypothetical protein
MYYFSCYFLTIIVLGYLLITNQDLSTLGYANLNSNVKL